MSIAKFQDNVLSKRGCGTASAIGIAFVMSFFIFGQCSRFSGNNGNPDAVGSTPVVSVGDVPVSASQITDDANRAMKDNPQSSFQSSAAAVSGALNNLLNSAAYTYLAKRDHLDVSDQAILRAAESQADMYVEMQKMNLKLRPGATPAETDAAFKKQTGRTVAELRKAITENVKKALANPEQRAKLVSSVIPGVVQNDLVAAAKPTDAEVRASYDTYTLKRILISRVPGMDAKKKAEEALAEIKKGMSFEAAMDKYSGEPPQPGKKVSDSTIPLPRSMMGMRPSYKVLEGQSAGFVSPVVEDPEGESIYKIVSITNATPKDFEAKREQYRKQFVQQQVQAKLQEQVKALLASPDVKWENKGYHALFEFDQAEQSTSLNRDTEFKRIADEAQAAAADPASHEPALYAWYEAESALYQSPTANKAALVPGRIDLLNAILDSSEEYEFRVELADLYTQEKKGPEALRNLVQAMQANHTYDVAGQRSFSDLSGKAEALVTQKLVSEADLKPFQEAQTAWKKSKLDEEKVQADLAAQQKAAKILDAANNKANQEALAKQKESMVKSKPPTSGAGPTTTTPPASPQGSSTGAVKH